jgi:hypothetical protein
MLTEGLPLIARFEACHRNYLAPDGSINRPLPRKAVALQHTGRLETYAASLDQEAVSVGIALFASAWPEASGSVPPGACFDVPAACRCAVAVSANPIFSLCLVGLRITTVRPHSSDDANLNCVPAPD